MTLSQEEKICRAYRVPPWIVSDRWPVPPRCPWYWRAWPPGASSCRQPGILVYTLDMTRRSQAQRDAQLNAMEAARGAAAKRAEAARLAEQAEADRAKAAADHQHLWGNWDYALDHTHEIHECRECGYAESARAPLMSTAPTTNGDTMTPVGDLAIGASFVWHGMTYTVLRERKISPAGYKIPVIKVGAGTEHWFNPTMEVERVMTFQVARNASTSLYELHTPGCKHLIAKHMELCGTADGPNAAAAAAAYEAGNDGILTKLGPCARSADRLLDHHPRLARHQERVPDPHQRHGPLLDHARRRRLPQRLRHARDRGQVMTSTLTERTDALATSTMTAVFATDGASNTWRVSDPASLDASLLTWNQLDEQLRGGLLPQVGSGGAHRDRRPRPPARRPGDPQPRPLRRRQGQPQHHQAGRQGPRLRQARGRSARRLEGVCPDLRLLVRPARQPLRRWPPAHRHPGPRRLVHHPNGQTAAQGLSSLAKVAKQRGLIVEGADGRWYVYQIEQL